ncbi:MAG: STAS domain-containing protein [Planctomycetes bacterium]|nr:STAS domain-containing protein [Planctomycetota bacterium]
MSKQPEKSPVKEIVRKDQAAIVKVVGDVDLNCSVEFQQSLMELLDSSPPPKKIVIDLTGVPYMDSSGVASLVKLLSRTRKSGATICLAGLCQRVRSVFEITRLDSVFKVCANSEEALK